MKLFGKTKMQKLETALAALTSRATLLTAKREAARAIFDRAVAARDVHLLEGNLEDEKMGAKLQAAVDSAVSALAGFDNVIAAQAASIAEAEEKLAVERLAVARKAASEELTAKTDTIERQIGPWLEATRALAASTTSVGDDVNFEVGQVGAYLRKVIGEVEMAIAMAIPSLRASAAAIVAGHLPIPRGPQDDIPAPVKAPTPQSAKIFTTKPIKFLDTATNSLKTWPAFYELDLRAELATRALALKAAVPIDSETAKKSLVKGGGVAFAWPDPASCISLDVEKSSNQSPYEPILHSAVQQHVPPGFQPLDRGKGFVIKVPAGNPPGEGEAA
jgi:hypothetical protein